ncbi:hypothetical protein ACOTDF_19335 [Achromobacter insuavis]|uniref:hypothetical protein n=1 Tax=Achromobacter insuavis TaxID=1287735 RepID=UPI003B992625
MHPTWLFHATEEPQIFTDADDLAEALRNGWADTPAAFLNVKTKDVEKTDEKDELIHQAKLLGMKVDARWSEARLRKEISDFQG